MLRPPADAAWSTTFRSRPSACFVQAGEKVMEVVPMGDKLLVETRVKPSDIAFIRVGDKALVKGSPPVNFSTYGGPDGRVRVQVSAGRHL